MISTPGQITTPSFRYSFNGTRLPGADGNARRVFNDVTDGVTMYAGNTRPHFFGVDMNGDNRYDPAKDGILTLDLNGDGKHDPRRTNNLMKVFAGGTADLNNDGKVTEGEKKRFSRLQAKGKELDLNRDGTLDAGELKKAGAKVTRQSLGPIDNLVTEDLTSEVFDRPQRDVRTPQVANPPYGTPYFGGPQYFNPFPQMHFFTPMFPMSPFNFFSPQQFGWFPQF